jgi:cyanate lyase
MEEIQISNISNNINEQRYLELANDMKEIVEKKDIEIKKVKEEIVKTKKCLYRFYGIMCYVKGFLDNIDFEDIFGYGDNIQDLLEFSLKEVEKNM